MLINADVLNEIVFPVKKTQNNRYTFPGNAKLNSLVSIPETENNYNLAVFPDVLSDVLFITSDFVIKK